MKRICLGNYCRNEDAMKTQGTILAEVESDIHMTVKRLGIADTGPSVKGID